MEYNTIKTRLKDRLTKEYKKTKHTEEYLKTEAGYKKTRESIKQIEAEITTMLSSFTATTFYANITSGLYSGFEILKDKIKSQKQPKTAAKEEQDFFGIFALSLGELASNTSGQVSKKFEDLSGSLKKISAGRVQFKESMSHNLMVIEEMKEKYKNIDGTRLRILDLRQRIESTSVDVDEEKLRREFTEECDQLYSSMRGFSSSEELIDLAFGIGNSMKNFFGDAFDALADSEHVERHAAE
ncbi:hypothetical protein NEDG_01485 [Nematocida displodere]|uniref:BAR domain-containing protein n=1 Tax=Nematocida displodere TaxID=1805483 RepID=A0A177EDP6_9MICR|nr:hypothetical protein NEDG_01485 [Nematocida displodere]